MVSNNSATPAQEFLQSLTHRIPQGAVVLYEDVSGEVFVHPLATTLESAIYFLERGAAILRESLPQPAPITPPQTPEEIEAEVQRRVQEQLAGRA